MGSDLRTWIACVLLCACQLAWADPSAPPPASAPDPSAAPTPASTPTSRSTPAPEHEYTLAFEVGHAWTANAGHAYGDGFGRTLMLAIKGIEVRPLETYDLEDRTGMLDARGVYGKLRMTSVGLRLRHRAGPLALRPLIGVTWIRRSAFTHDELSTAFERRTQHGLAVQAGVGLELRLRAISIGFDVRAYPTLWSELAGEIAIIRDGGLVYEPITDSPGGVPRTVSGWVAVHW